MIKSVRVINFQSHKDSFFEFDKGMNIIIGPSDNGKTTAIRAIKWVVDNRPSGDEFRSSWGGDTSVEIATFEGDRVKRVKTNKINSYEVNDTELVAFGQDVPEEVRGVLNMDHINLQQQLDAPFLLSETSGFAASHFNKVAKLQQIDKSRAYVQSEINRINGALKSGVKAVEEKTEQLEGFVNLHALEKDLLSAEKLQVKYENTKEVLNALSVLLFKIERKENAFEALKNAVLPEKSINDILKMYETVNAYRVTYSVLKKAALSIHSTQKAIKKAEKVVPAENGIDKIIKQHASLREVVQETSQIQKLYTRIERKEEARKTALKQLTLLEKEFHENFPKECPLCNSKIK